MGSSRFRAEAGKFCPGLDGAQRGLRWAPNLPGKQGRRKLSGPKDFLAGQTLPSGA